MIQRVIGDSGILVSAMGMGTTKFGRTEQVKYSHKFSLPSEKQILRLLKTASQQGINLIDTAPAYGMSEQILGKLLQGWRKDWLICTKVGEEFQDGKSSYDFSKAAIWRSLERSLKNLQTDYLDIVLLHSNGKDQAILPSLEFLSAAKQSGMIRLFGMSSKTVAGGIKALKYSDVAMVHYNLAHQECAAVIRFAESINKGILIKKALESGHLVAQDATKNLKNNIDFILSQKAVSSVVLGTISHQHLLENILLF